MCGGGGRVVAGVSRQQSQHQQAGIRRRRDAPEEHGCVMSGVGARRGAAAASDFPNRSIADARSLRRRPPVCACACRDSASSFCRGQHTLLWIRYAGFPQQEGPSKSAHRFRGDRGRPSTPIGPGSASVTARGRRWHRIDRARPLESNTWGPTSRARR